MILAIPIIGGVIVGVKWICTVAIPWLAAKVVIFWGYLTAKNLFLLGLVIWLAAELTGWGDGFLGFLIWALGYIGGLIYDFIFGEDGIVWYIFDFGLWFANWTLDYLENYWVFSEFFGKAFMQFDQRLLSTVIPLFMGLNVFFPVSESLVFLHVFLGIMLFVFLFRFCVKLIPGLGG